MPHLYRITYTFDVLAVADSPAAAARMADRKAADEFSQASPRDWRLPAADGARDWEITTADQVPGWWQGSRPYLDADMIGMTPERLGWTVGYWLEWLATERRAEQAKTDVTDATNPNPNIGE